MRIINVAAFAAALVVVPTTAFAQATPIVVAAPAVAGPVLPAGTTVRLRMLSTLNSQDSKTGQQFDLEAAEDVLLDGRVVIPRGSPATGELTLVKKKGMWGKSGKLEGRIVSVRTGGRDIALRGSLNDKGVTGTAAVVGAIAFLPVAGFFVTGTSADIPSGTTIMAKTESDIPVSFAR
jgi:hypothetical protein